MELTNPADIRALLARHDFRFSKSMGQNFLTAAWVPADIADASGADEHTGVLEVGPGIGCLTEQLAQRAAKVVSVELDERLRPVLAETLAAYPNVEIVFGDVLALDLRQLAAERFPGLRPVVCANLPYNVTSPLITAFLTAGCFDTVTVMIQREAAHRLCARPGTADYGLLRDAAEAAELMGREQIRRLPILENGRLCGMVSLGDLAMQDETSIDAGDALTEISNNLSSRDGRL